MRKLFVVSKLVMASSIEEALKLERKTPPTAVYLDDDWKKNNLTHDYLNNSKKEK